jgi:excisionase family DNA binding protein
MRTPDYLTPIEAARELRVAETTILRWIRQGRLPATRTAGGRHYRILREDLALALLPVRRTSEGRP